MVIGLWIDYSNGRTSFKTFASAFDRGLFMIALADQPLVLRPVTYSEAARRG